jgi:hypothetical protein
MAEWFLSAFGFGFGFGMQLAPQREGDRAQFYLDHLAFGEYGRFLCLE